MNDRQLRPVYLIGMGGSAYALWYFYSVGETLLAVAFAVLTVFCVVRLRKLSTDT
ncbi:hypothetical protein [Natrinema salinisoli]|uniref:hypothetical protein n=1 Tax=Natrinema salinisoli TaxID=2878535 RepID=UPI001CEFFF53|nr:hypothetical protein [Natrinema salinisoli]